MSASSSEWLATLAGVTINQVLTLLRILAQISMRRRQFVKARFIEQARNFPETVDFLKKIGWIREHGEEILLTTNGEEAATLSQDEEEIRKRLAAAMIETNSPYQELLANYLLQFSPLNSELVFRPPISDRLQESPLRNLLIDMRIVAYRVNDDTYILDGDGTALYIWAKIFMSHTSKNILRAASRQKEDLGFAAELAILAYEKERIGGQWAFQVEHVSLDHPFACYDIKSVTIYDGDIQPRYIEVKAVPIDSYQFYWTAYEVEAAQLLRDKYFLYLLPVLTNRNFDLARLLIVEDPWLSVYHNSQQWAIEENVIICRRNPSS